MLISQLPKTIQEKAIKYQRENKDFRYDMCSNQLGEAFDWSQTKEGLSYWLAWQEAEDLEDQVIPRYCMSKADLYYLETINEIEKLGEWDDNPRPKWSDGNPAYSKFISQKDFVYRIDKGEFPIVSLRPTALKGAFYDIEAIYIKQTNIIEEMNPLIHSWWEPFVVSENMRDKNGHNYSMNCYNTLKSNFPKQDFSKDIKVRSIGQTYGHTVKRYDLVNKLLKSMETNPFGRRHIMNLWQEQQMIEDPKALVPCAYETSYTISQEEDHYYVDMTLNQRSQDFMMTASINPMQYVMLGQMICGHLTHKTGFLHELRKFKHSVQNVHIYDRHFGAVEEIKNRTPQTKDFYMYISEAKDFYSYTFEDFKFENIPNPKPLKNKLEIAI